VSEFTLIDSTGSIVPLQAVTVDFGTGQSAAVVRLELIQPPAHAGTLFLMAATGGDGTTFSDRCGNFVTAGQQLALIDVGNDVAVDIGSDIGQCPDAPRPVLQAPVLPGAGYAWTFNGTAAGTNAPTLQTVLPGTYAVAVTLGTGCGAADSMALSLWPAPFVDLGDDTLICNGGTLPVLDAGTGGTGYAWYLDGTALATTGNMLQTTQAGWYAVQVAGTYCTTTDSIHIEAFPAIAVGLVQREYLICEGELIDPVIPDPALQYTWTMSGPTLFDSPEEIHSPSPGYLKQGWYVLTVADTNGCAVTDSIHVTVLEQPEAPVTGCPVYAGMDMTFSWTPVPGAEWYEVSEDEGNTWQYPSSGSAAFTHTTRVGLPRLMVRAMSEGNCGPGRVAEQESCGVLIPSAISPNGDGHNDFFRMANLGQYDAPSLSVFNRYGQRVFFSPDYQNDWNAEGLQRGTYFYVLDLHRHGSLRGFITVVR